MEDTGASSEDDGLPRSPPESSPIHEALARSQLAKVQGSQSRITSIAMASHVTSYNNNQSRTALIQRSQWKIKPSKELISENQACIPALRAQPWNHPSFYNV